MINCVRNESDKQFLNLSPILVQHQPNFEVIVVNYQSMNNSKGVLYAFCQQYVNLRTI